MEKVKSISYELSYSLEVSILYSVAKVWILFYPMLKKIEKETLELQS